MLTTNAYLLGMLAVLAACTIKLGPLAMFNLYFVPYWMNVVWLDVVTYLHHHGSHEQTEKMPWYRGEVGSGFPSIAGGRGGRAGEGCAPNGRAGSGGRAALPRPPCYTQPGGVPY